MVVGFDANLSALPEEDHLTKYEHSFAGFFSGFLTRAIIQPLDVLKIRFQLQEEAFKSGHGKYRSILQAISLIHNEEGIRAFWKGHVPAQGLSSLYGLVQFTVFENLSRKIRHSAILSNDHVTDFVCGSVAGCSATTTTIPLDVIRTRLVAQGKSKVYRGSADAFFKIWQVEGVRGYFRGLIPSLCQIIPFAGLNFMCYNLFNRFWLETFRNSGVLLDSFGTITCGFLSGSLAKSTVYPLDLIRHRFQVNAQLRHGFGSTTNYSGVLNAFMTVIKRETFFGLFKGLFPSILKTGSNSAFSFFFYEIICRLLRTNKKSANSSTTHQL